MGKKKKKDHHDDIFDEKPHKNNKKDRENELEALSSIFAVRLFFTLNFKDSFQIIKQNEEDPEIFSIDIVPNISSTGTKPALTLQFTLVLEYPNKRK